LCALGAAGQTVGNGPDLIEVDSGDKVVLVCLPISTMADLPHGHAGVGRGRPKETGERESDFPEI
jgi:hypothetical protein